MQLSESDHRLVEATFAAAELPYGGESIWSERKLPGFSAMVRQPAIGAIAVVSELLPGSSRAVEGRMSPLCEREPAAALRGLFRHDRGSFMVPDGTGCQKPMRISVINSEQAVRAAQRELGQNPGRDSFGVRRVFARREQAPGEYVEGAAELRTPSTAGSTSLLLHDLNPPDHLLVWRSLYPGASLGIARYGGKLIERYGERIHADKPDRPQEVGDFAEGLDGLPGYVGLIDKILYRVEEPDYRIKYYDANDPPMVALRELVGETTNFFTMVQVRGEFFKHLAQLGLCEAGDRDAAQKVSRSLVAYMAQQRINLEDIRPKVDDTPKLRVARIATWSEMSREFGHAA